jgi:putative zinc finger/helix-turn-helix YgiT family protein
VSGTKKMHKCPDCGQSVPLRREEVPFGLVGNWAVTVEAQVYDCACGRGVVYEDVGPMLQAIAAAVIKKPSRLASEEIRFLREHLQMSAKEFGRLLGVTPSQVSRWENGAPMGATADRLVRMIEVQHDNLEFDVQQLAKIGDTSRAPMRLSVLRNKDGSWKAAA